MDSIHPWNGCFRYAIAVEVVANANAVALCCVHPRVVIATLGLLAPLFLGLHLRVQAWGFAFVASSHVAAISSIAPTAWATWRAARE